MKLNKGKLKIFGAVIDPATKCYTDNDKLKDGSYLKTYADKLKWVKNLTEKELDEMLLAIHNSKVNKCNL